MDEPSDNGGRSLVPVARMEAAGKANKCTRLPKEGQEYLSIDVMAFPAGPAPSWPFPLAVFELENQYQRVAYSLWKVLCIPHRCAW